MVSHMRNIHDPSNSFVSWCLVILSALSNMHDRRNSFDPSILGRTGECLTVETVDRHDLALVGSLIYQCHFARFVYPMSFDFL